MKAFLITLFLASTIAHAQSATYIGEFKFKGSDDDYIAGPISYSFSENTGTFRVNLSDDRRTLEIEYEDYILPGETFPEHNFGVEFGVVPGKELTSGKDSIHATRFGVSDDNGFNLSGDGRGCNELTADFTINKLEYDKETKQLTSFDADYTQYCENGKAYLRGTIVLNLRQ